MAAGVHSGEHEGDRLVLRVPAHLHTSPGALGPTGEAEARAVVNDLSVPKEVELQLFGVRFWTGDQHVAPDVRADGVKPVWGKREVIREGALTSLGPDATAKLHD